MTRRDSNTERKGVYRAAIIFTEEIEWVFRELNPVDVGLDALIEMAENGDPSAKFIAVQIKSGEGNFYEGSHSYTYYISNWHYHYWLNSNLPVILVAHFPNSGKTIWENLEIDKVKRTAKKWKIQIPKNKELSVTSKKELSGIINKSEQDDFYLNINPEDYTDDNYVEIDDGVDEIKLASNSLRKILDLFNGFGDSVEPINKEISKPKYLYINKTDIRVKRMVVRFSKLILQLTDEVDKEIEIFSSNASSGFRKYEKLVAINFAVTLDVQSAIDSLEIVFNISMNFIDAIRSTKEFLGTVDSLPKEFSEINFAKKGLKESAEALLEEFTIVSDFMDSFILRSKSFMMDRL